MSDRIASTLSDTRATVEQHHARGEELLAKIEQTHDLPNWCWSRMLDTAARLSELPDECAWTVPAYLSAVLRRGSSMFTPPTYQQQLAEEQPVATMPCPCGHAIPAPRPQRRDSRMVQVATCSRCGIDVAQFDEEPYPHRTLLSHAHV